ncbi:XRE family transcriptional regulator [Lacihabitans sp. CCS-44]|uniref:helix-turn-helix transcriptional regulator n=1 Tax=Lacihabitans sp. CCS-44 TaxID=2487331 RepID=UPI0020CDC328|nr:helix-turn-helix transcriptional regulator [Lacihabitans sp. CCS-44]MCP9756114.1 XRE family transcriptional regulator [Lacihabitans sp. CCS-44]
MTKSYFSENLKNLRKYHKITLEELAEALNVSKSALSDYENDKFSPSLIICRKIADHFKTSVDILEFSEILEKTEKNNFVLKNIESLPKQILEAKEYAEVLEKQKNELMLELRLQKQKVESLTLQMRLQEQLKASKLSEIELLRSQIILLEEKIKLIQK